MSLPNVLWPKVKAMNKHIGAVQALLDKTIPLTTTPLSEVNVDDFHETRLIWIVCLPDTIAHPLLLKYIVSPNLSQYPHWVFLYLTPAETYDHCLQLRNSWTSTKLASAWWKGTSVMRSAVWLLGRQLRTLRMKMMMMLRMTMISQKVSLSSFDNIPDMSSVDDINDSWWYWWYWWYEKYQFWNINQSVEDDIRFTIWFRGDLCEWWSSDQSAWKALGLTCVFRNWNNGQLFAIILLNCCSDNRCEKTHVWYGAVNSICTSVGTSC